MSLLRRVERAQQAAELAQQGAGEATSSRPLVPVMSPPARPPEGAGQGSPTPVPVLGAISRSPVREDLMREIRMKLQAEVVNAFDTLLDIKPAEVRERMEAIVDRTITANGFAVTRDDRAVGSIRARERLSATRRYDADDG